MIIDFSFILVAAALVTGVVWGVYAYAIKPQREKGLAKGELPSAASRPIP